MYYLCSEKTKALISLAVTAKLICVYVFAYAKSRFSHDAAHIQFMYMCVLCYLSFLFEEVSLVQ